MRRLQENLQALEKHPVQDEVITLWVIVLKFLEFCEVTVVDLVEGFILPAFGRFAVGSERVVDLGDSLVVKDVGIIG